MSNLCYTMNQTNYNKIPGSPIAYWASKNIVKAFENKCAKEFVNAVKGLDTCDNERFVRLWYEVNVQSISFTTISTEYTYNNKWYPYCKGGGFKKWYGFLENIVEWKDDGSILRNIRDENGKIKSRPQNTKYYFREGMTFSTITSNKLSMRYMNNCIFGGGGSGIFGLVKIKSFMAFLNSNVAEYILDILNPTLNFLVGDILSLPIVELKNDEDKVINLVDENISISRTDWDSFETSWDFKKHPLI